MYRQLGLLASRLPGLLMSASRPHAVELARLVSCSEASTTAMWRQQYRPLSSTPTPSQAPATPAEAQQQADITQTEYKAPLGPPSVPAFGLGLFAILAATANEWLYFTDEFIEIAGFWALFLTVYRLVAPSMGQMFDESSQAIRQGELDKIRQAREALGLEELAKRYAPATAEAKKLVDSELSTLASLTPKMEAYVRSTRVQALLDMHIEAQAMGDQVLKQMMVKRFRRSVLNQVVNKGAKRK